MLHQTDILIVVKFRGPCHILLECNHATEPAGAQWHLPISSVLLMARLNILVDLLRLHLGVNNINKILKSLKQWVQRLKTSDRHDKGNFSCSTRVGSSFQSQFTIGTKASLKMSSLECSCINLHSHTGDLCSCVGWMSNRLLTLRYIIIIIELGTVQRLRCWI